MTAFREYLETKINENLDQINRNQIGYFVSYSLCVISQLHVWHLLAQSGQKHTALGCFYNELSGEIDKLAEKYLAQGGYLDDCPKGIIASYSDDEILREIDLYRKATSLLIDEIKFDSEMESMKDSLIDIQEIIDANLYKFKLQ